MESEKLKPSERALCWKLARSISRNGGNPTTMQGILGLRHHWFWGKSFLVENLCFRMEAGSYQVGPLCLCLYIIWSSRSFHLLHMIWYSGAHWSMADCTVSSFFTLSHIPTFKLLKLDLRTWIDSNTPSLSFRVTPIGCRSNQWAWIAMAQKQKKKKISHSLQKQHQKVFHVTPSCHFLSGFLKYLCCLPDTFFPFFGKNLFWIQMKQPHRNWSWFNMW